MKLFNVADIIQPVYAKPGANKQLLDRTLKFSYSVTTGEHLPDVEGPKMHPFRDCRRTEIEWIHHVAETDASLVHAVRIEGATYALKIMRLLRGALHSVLKF
jgi:hypothetical protein